MLNMKNTLSDNHLHTFALTSYIFISAILVFLGGATLLELWQIGKIGLTILCGLFIVFIIGLFWCNYYGVSESKKWWIFYYLIQTVLMLSTTLLLSQYTRAGLSLLFSMTICIVGESLALWGNSRYSLFIGVFYFALLFSVLFFFGERADFYKSLLAMLINGIPIILLIALINQQLIERQKAVELAESLESANAKLAAYNAKIESLTLQNERQRMARELHDTLAQGVAGLVLQLEAVKAHLASDRKERASSIVEQALLRARDTLSESRAAIDNLRSTSSNFSESLQEKINRFTQSTGIVCETEISVYENQLSNELTEHASSILSEALANITKHAQAKNVKVKFIIQNKNLELEVQDDGIGFDINQKSSGHYGLLGMKERAKLANGNLLIESNQHGTRIYFSIGAI